MANLLFSKSHEWVEFIDDTTARIGLTDYAQNQLGDLVFVNLPEEGDSFGVEEVFGDVESVKAVSDVYCPVAGEVKAVNEKLLDSPQLINEAPYEAWMIELENITDRGELMDQEAYEAFVREEA